MAYLGKGRREDLFVLATELNLKFDKSMTIATLKDLIIGSEDYDEELTKNIHSTIVEDRKAREENLRIEEQKEKRKLRIEEQKKKLRIEEQKEEKEREEKLRFEQLRLDEQKRKDEFELEKLRIQTQSKLGADTSKESDTKFLVKEISKFIHRFDLKEDISLYLKLFERQAQRLNIDQENWVSHLLGLLPTEVSHIIAREPDDKANSYEHVKDLLLKRFKLTPEKFRQLFVTHQKAPERTWIDFYHELNTYFNGWIDGLKIDTFNKLSDLIITDQLKRKTPFEFKEYYLDEWANMNSPVQLAEKLEEFEDFKRTLKQKSSSPFVKKQEFRFTEKNRRYEAPGKFEYNRKDKKFPASTNYNKHYEAPVTKYESVQRYQDSAQKGYYNKNYEKHSNHNASKHAQTNYSKSQKFKEPPKETCTLIVKEGLRTKEIFFGKVKITALIDSGSTVSLLRENTSRRIMDPTKLSKNKMLLTGIGEAQVTTIGSFEHEFKIDDENYSLTWHVVPTDKLKFEAVIGSDLLEQASISFTKEGVKFNKYENHAQLMQISAENLQEELDLRHVENRQIKKELEKLIQDYKPEKTASTDVTMRIILKDEEPVCQPPRRLAFTERQEVNKQIEEWLNEGIIRPSSAEYASPIVMVKKKDGSSRMCIDYRKLNQKLVKDKFPLPIIEDVLDTLQEAKVYSTLDLRNGFFHVDVDEDCRKYTSFIVPDGQFEFNKVPFGLSTSPGVFQRYVSSIFRDLTRKGIVISYLDDLVIPAKNEQEGLEKLKIIFEVAKKYGLEIKFKKCQFLKKKIEFLGHIVESGTIKPSPTKTLAVRKFPEPTTIKQVQSFLGLTGYFRKYIKDYSKIAKPLSDLTRKENLFVFFGIQQKEAFEKLKKIMSEGPILHLYKYGRKTELHTDACKQGYGAILLQEAEDGKLHPVYYMSKKTNTAEEKYDSYELEVLAIINALKKFRVYLLGQHFKIVTDCSAFQKTMQKKELITRIARWALQLEEFDYEIEHRAGSRMKHVDALSRYPVMMLIRKLAKRKGFLNPISKESIPLSTYHVDFIGPLPSTNKNYQHIFTVVDAFTKFTWLYPVKTVSAESALEKLKQQQKTFGNPIRIISDRGSAFTSKLFNDYCDEENIQHLQIATGVPRGNGQVERIHRTLIPVLTKLSLDDSTKWYKYVDRLQRILNSTISRSTKWTPFELLVGIKMRNKEDILIKDLLLEEMAKELLEQREFLRNDAKKNIETLQSENRKTYNRRRKKASLYKEGDLVAIQRTQFGAGLKLRPKFLGPYKVTKVNSKDRYEVEKVGQHDGPNSTTTSADLMKHFYA
ncbi:retrovirus-related Pol polyprotein from transposon 17.6 [Trichonephila clavipes]|uniref:RNA-directed DNA polymerase n=2 Tax=Trichonephila clavipes TaxID=2585209 RepID=A0A8X6RJG3_TRICX|nr:retrovirus-related Pol polyprotein from transposon 17.6 [Trichonephila clavipes]